MTSEHTDCVVVGGGPSGLTLALLLARIGWQVVVIERDDGTGPPRVDISPYLAPPSLRLYQDLGLAGELASVGQPLRELVEHTRDGGVFVIDYADRVHDDDPPYALSVSLWKLSQLLREFLLQHDNAKVLLSSSVQALESRAEEVVVDLGDRTFSARVLACSDGKFSTVRTMARIDTEVFEFDRPLVMLLPEAPPVWPECLAVHHTGEDGLVAAMPVANGLLAVQWLGSPAEYDALRSGNVAGLLDRITAVIPELAGPLAKVDDWDEVLAVQHHVVRPEAWSRGRVVLLGDTAHGVHSLGGQGLNLGIQDAVVLGSVLAGAGPDAVPAVLAEYEQLRRPFVTRFQRYQTILPQLTTTGTAWDGKPIYAAVAEIMAQGQPEVAAGYRRLVSSTRSS